MLEAARPKDNNQSLIVSGESGAGKTEAAKQVMKYLTALSARFMIQQDKAQGGSGIVSKNNIEVKVLKSNPFLEAFGNAKTLRNNNSSRFGKFLKIQYLQGGIVGATMEHYLLEKARVVKPLEGERNFHIFYQLCVACPEDLRADLQLSTPDKYDYLTNGNCVTVENIDDKEEFADVMDGLSAVGIEAPLQASMWRVIAGIMNLGNIKFKDVATKDADNKSQIKNPGQAETTAELFGTIDLPRRLVTQRMKVGMEVVERHQDARRAKNSRNALAKHVYDRMFTWLIGRVNSVLAYPDGTNNFIGILDIFGFEIFAVNSFEQLCINFANEKLQSLFNTHIFTMEQEMYKMEGVDVTSIKFRNNQPCVELIEAGAKNKNKAPPGILTLLDDVCRGGQQGMTDEKFLDTVVRAHQGENEYFLVPKVRSMDKFSVKHFAGAVTYTVKNFIGKNNDKLNDDLEEMMAESKVSFVRTLFSDDFSAGEGAMTAAAAAAAAGSGVPGTPSSPRKGKGSTAPTIGGRFKRQLKHLYDTLLHTNPHYIRTIKPNEVKKPQVFEAPKILEQLLYSGVLETVRIRREGYPFREPYVDFWRRATRCGQARGYIHMVPKCDGMPIPPLPEFKETSPGMPPVDVSITPSLIADSKRGTEVLLSHLLDNAEFVMGHTKIFMKDGCLDRIHTKFRAIVMNDIMNFCKRRLRWMRFRYARANRLKRRIAVRHLVRRYRAWQMKKKYEGAVRHVTNLQAHIKARQTRKWFVQHKDKRLAAATKIQATFRMYRVNKRAIRGRWALRLLQKKWRAKLEHRRRVKMMKDIIKVQCVVRMISARRRVRTLLARRQAAAIKIQAFVRSKRQRAQFVVFRAAVFNSASKRVQSVARGFIERRRLAKQHAAATRIQASIKARQTAKAYRKEKSACRAINKWIIGNYRRWALREWVAEVFACASNGYAEDVAELLARTQDTYRWLRDIPQQNLARLRDPDDGFKTLMHAAALSGDLETTRLLVQVGCSVEVADVTGATPLHKAAAIGDSHLPVVQYMVNLLPQTPDDDAQARVASLSARYVLADASGVPGAPKRSVDIEAAWGKPYATRQLCFVNTPSAAGETALDCAVSIQRSRGRREHDDTMHYLLSVGGISHIMGSRDAVMGLLQGLQSDAAVAAAAAARERELLERRRLEREHNPHYQFLLVQEQERKRSAESAKTAAAQRSHAEAAQRMAVREKTQGLPSPGTNAGHNSSSSEAHAPAGSALAAAAAKGAARAGGSGNTSSNGGGSRGGAMVPSIGGRFSAGGVTYNLPDASAVSASGSPAGAPLASSPTGGSATQQHSASSPAAEFMQSLNAASTSSSALANSDPYRSGRLGTAAVGNRYGAAGDSVRGSAGGGAPTMGSATSHAASSSPDIVSLRLEPAEAARLASKAAAAGVTLSAAADHMLRSTAASSAAAPAASTTSATSSREATQGSSSSSRRALARQAVPTPLEQDSAPPKRDTSEKKADSGSTAARSHRSVSTWKQSKDAQGAPAALAVPVPAANPNWAVHQSNSTGLLYYHHAVTGATQWTEPSDFDSQYEPWMLDVCRKSDVTFTLAMQRDAGMLQGGGVDLVAAVDRSPPKSTTASDALAATYGGSSSTGRLTGQEAVAAADAEDGPPSRWAVYETDDGIAYFYDKLTDTTTWDKPKCLATRERESVELEVVQATAAGGAPAEEEEVNPDGLQGRNGWTSYTDEEGYVYYHNSKTGATQWDAPSDC